MKNKRQPLYNKDEFCKLLGLPAKKFWQIKKIPLFFLLGFENGRIPPAPEIKVVPRVVRTYRTTHKTQAH